MRPMQQRKFAWMTEEAREADSGSEFRRFAKRTVRRAERRDGKREAMMAVVTMIQLKDGVEPAVIRFEESDEPYYNDPEIGAVADDGPDHFEGEWWDEDRSYDDFGPSAWEVMAVDPFLPDRTDDLDPEGNQEWWHRR
jgi:hypothetical protein